MGANLPQSVQLPVSVSAGTTALVPAPTTAFSPNARVRVVSAYLVATAAGTFNFQSHTTTSDATGPASIAANGVIVLPYNEDGWFTTIPGEGLDIVTTAAFAGSINFVQV
jgi:hypothetical protein